MADCRSTIDRKTPRLRRWRVSLEKKPSTALSQEPDFGVKWKVDDRSDDAAPNALAGKFGEEAFDGIEPGAGFRSEVEGPARVPGEPGFDFWVGVRGVVVDNGMDQLAGRNRALDGIEEADELLVPVSLHAAAEDDPIERVEGGKQGGRAVPLVIMGHGAAPARLDRQAGLGAIERLDL